MTEMLSWTPFDAARWAAPFDLFTSSPFSVLDSFQRLFDGGTENTAMRVEEAIEDNMLVVRAELPGVDPDKDVDVSIADGVLNISATREQKTEKHTDGSYRTEFHYGSLQRRIALPDGVSETDIKASYKDGILEVRAPLPAKAVPAAPAKVAITRD
ncbi:Hsp20/alpha crystallin family protein [Arthrobacter wenxiniae]|jgi:HSP20 family protein|uniref:Hsp20/alpha crystallin family protein n=1 Tax=Arthrobacter wenxiniae TaxID=2713570 RepID=A0A7Y7IEY2_9MICC|nr:Hsp20/alpha crystallin family protein [Arthrobacter wenxiniae]NVM94218.1 Hsp20/alpha crystallin family protein [Arthrobacter wenxiniae]